VAVLIIFPVILQTVINLVMLSIEGWEAIGKNMTGTATLAKAVLIRKTDINVNL